MSRSGYTVDCDVWDLIRYRGAVKSAMRGARGQQFFKELLSAMDAMPEKVLIAHELVEEGSYCALGVIGAARGIDLTAIDAQEPEDVAAAFNIAEALAREIVFMNDEWGEHNETPEHRWIRMRAWVEKQIIKEAACSTSA